jgi:hypothetical protein
VDSADAGGIPALVELLHGEHGLDAQREATMALWALADHDGNRLAIAAADGIAPLVELLDSANAAVRKHAEGTLVRMSLDSGHRTHIIERLVHMLEKDSSGQDRGQEQAAFTLSNLARELPDARQCILEHGGIPKLVALLSVTSTTTKEHALSAIAQIANKNQQAQSVIGAEDGGISALVTNISGSLANIKESSGVQLWAVGAMAIWRVADGNRENQTRFLKEGAVPAIVQLLTSAHVDLRTNACGAIAALARGHTECNEAFVRCAAVESCTRTLKDAINSLDKADMVPCQEEAACALWAIAAEGSNAIKAKISDAGGIALLMSLLTFGTTDACTINASNALAALARGDSANLKNVTHALVQAIGQRVSPAKAVKLLSAIALLCNNGRLCQEAVCNEPGVFPALINWMTSSQNKEVQAMSARVMFALASNNANTQRDIGLNSSIPPLVKLLEVKYDDASVYEAQDFAACALWRTHTQGSNTGVAHLGTTRDASGLRACTPQISRRTQRTAN